MLVCFLIIGRHILFIASEIEFCDLTSTVLSNKSMYIITYKNDEYPIISEMTFDSSHLSFYALSPFCLL